MNLILIYLMLLFIMVVLLLFWMLIFKWKKEQLQNRWDNSKEHVLSFVKEYVNNETTPFPRMFLSLEGEFRKWVFEQLAYYIKEGFIGNNDRLVQLLKETGFYNEIMDQLADGRWIRRLEGLNSVSIFHLFQAKEKVITLLTDPRPLIRWKAFDTLGIIGDFEDFSLLVLFIAQQQVNDYPKLQRFVSVLDNLKGYQDDSYHLILSTYRSTNNVFAKRCLLDLLGKKKFTQTISFLQEQLHHNEPEIRIGAIKSLIEMQVSEAIPQFIELVKWSENNSVKIVAMKGIAYLGGDKYKQVMIDNLGHSLWWIRYYSALGITRLEKDSKELLQSLSVNYPDKYGRDMAKYFLQVVEKEEWPLSTLQDRILKIG